MRISIVFIGLIYMVFSCQHGNSEASKANVELNTAQTKGEAAILFRNTTADLGSVKEGEKVIAWYEYKNCGDAVLLIDAIEAGCGCTLPKWDSEPLIPGDSAVIKVVFDSSGKKGYQNIRVLVNSNAENKNEVLKLIAQVEKD